MSDPRTFAIGDIHGCLRSLRLLEESVPFQPRDRIITLGDYVDRGFQSCQVLDWLLDRKSRYELITIRGNHEVMMQCAREGAEYLQDWLTVGGDTTLESYRTSPSEPRLKDIPSRHWKLLDSGLLPYYETATHAFLHACYVHDLPFADQPDDVLYWSVFNSPPPHISGKTVICGHTSQRTGLPRNIGHAVCIDTWAYGAGWLTCLEPSTGRFWQASERGFLRSGEL